MGKKELTTEINLVKKISDIEAMLDIIEEDLENKENPMNLISNVVYILPDIEYYWSLIEKDEQMTLFELIDICEVWVDELAIAVVQNQNHLKNVSLSKHLYNVVEICRFIMKATHNHLYGLNQPNPE